METIWVVLLFVVGLVLIIKGGDFFVDAASWMAEASGIPKLIIGATVVSFATTLPELLVSLFAALDDKVDLAIGNAVGSVTANIGLIMGIALVCMPTVIKRRDYLVKSLLMLGAATIIMLSGFTLSLGLLPSLLLLGIFVFAMYENITEARRGMAVAGANGRSQVTVEKKVLATNLAKFILGAVGIVIGAQLLVDNGSELARIAGVPERIIGVTLIAVGTSLPELVTTITAIGKKQASLSIGNIIGANIIDLTLILPLCNVLSGQALPVGNLSALVDLPACLLVGCIAVIPALITKKFHRWQGFLLLAIYAAYMYVTVTL